MIKVFLNPVDKMEYGILKIKKIINKYNDIINILKMIKLNIYY